MHWSKRWTALLGIVALAFAAAAGARTPPGGEIKVHETSAGSPYVTGGVGDVQQAIMESRYDDYSLKLVNVRSGPEAAYVANVDVTVSNQAGEKVLETTTQGPWLIADLPAGVYDVRASFDGATKTMSVNIPSDDDRQRRVFDWNTRG